MSQLTMLRDLFAHMTWADRLVLQAAMDSPLAREDARVREKLHHLHLVQRAFLHLWTRTPFALRELSSFTSLSDIAAWASEYHAEAHSFMEGIGEAALGEIVPIPWAERVLELTGGKEARPVQLGETMMQVAMHSGYHRGQVNMRLRELGSVPPLTDYIAWLWLGRPDTPSS